MTLSAKFRQLDLELDTFLGAQIGEELSGAPLSVLSAMTRLGIDPWTEGARLSDLSRDNATRELMALIAMFPLPARSTPEEQALAERLAALLPQRGSKPMALPTLTLPTGLSARRIVSRPPDLRDLPVLFAGLLIVLCVMAGLGILPGQ